MSSVFWGSLAYVLFPTACLSLFLMLSGVRLLERLGCSICCLDLSVGSQLKINVLLFCVLLSLAGFVQSHMGMNKEWDKIHNVGGSGSNSNSAGTATVTNSDGSTTVEKINVNVQGSSDSFSTERARLNLFRDQRNWWISLCNLVLWLTCWRVQSIMRMKRERDDALAVAAETATAAAGSSSAKKTSTTAAAGSGNSTPSTVAGSTDASKGGEIEMELRQRK